MPQTVIALGQIPTEEVLSTLAGKFVHAPTNMVERPLETGETEVINGWFCGRVAGFEKAHIYLDIETGEFKEEPDVYFTLLFTDGAIYPLSKTEIELLELTQEEFMELVEEQRKKLQAKVISLPEKKIIVPGEGY